LPVCDDPKAEGMPPSKPKAPKEAKPSNKRPVTPASLRRVRPPRLYVYFDAIIRHGSIRRAAEALRIASSALNRRLLDLEQEVGTSCSTGSRAVFG
jgi:hypothetical protein